MVNLSGKQKWCKILIDEVHIKPAIRYRGNHLIGSAIDDPTKAARTALTIMICPLMVDLHLWPGYYQYIVTHEIMYDAISKIISIVHKFSGRVLHVMNYNLNANVSCFAKIS